MEEPSLQTLPNRKIFKGLFLNPGLPASILGVCLGLSIVMVILLNEYTIRILGLTISAQTLAVLLGLLGLFIVPAAFMGLDFHTWHGKMVYCSDCGKIRHSNAITREQNKKYCGGCYHEII